jgi:hypothetical protein
MESESNIEARVRSLETYVQLLREELRDEIKKAAHELKGDSDFIKPYWRDGAEHFFDHLLTMASRRVFWLVLGAIGTALTLWAGSSGIFGDLLK